ncbi:MAG: hypothetical protein WBL23_10660 [Salinisphaera sp.]|uniref:hypothetical protein n=1 Tax=Salinisphaera sp. TaxID=1914330 RepID=UPI003C7986BD
MVATRIRDWLLHYSYVITNGGDRYKPRARRKTGPIKPDPIHHYEQVVRGDGHYQYRQGRSGALSDVAWQ